jgi:inorganic pyrophosphatase
VTSKEIYKEMTNYLELPVGDRAPEVFRAVIEIPKDGTQKFEYDKQLHVFKLDRNLHSPVHYPGDYGFIPSSLSDDGDPLDVLVLVPDPSFPGCVQEVRPIGLLEMMDQGILDEKVLAVGKNNPRFANIWNFTDIYPHLLKEITHFFSIYKDLEGKRVEIRGWHDASYARDRVARAIKLYQEGKTKRAEAEQQAAVPARG